MLGQTLGPYLIERELGRGGMGHVYRAVQSSLGRRVAVKTLLPHLAADEDFVKRFLREARAMAQLRHPGIVTIHDVGEENGTYYFAMEYVEGRTLSDVIGESGALPVDDALHYVRQVAAALGHAHAAGILHRDVKPSNIMLDPNDQPILTDFGIAWAQTDTRLTQAGAAVGSPDYMSPEQVKGEVLDARSDLYSLGVVLYQALTGKVPYAGDNASAVAFQHVTGPVPSPRAVNPSVPAQLDAVVQQLLSKDPAERYRSAAELIEVLSPGAAYGGGGHDTRTSQKTRISGSMATVSGSSHGIPQIGGAVTPPQARGRGQSQLIASLAFVVVVFAVGAGTVLYMTRDQATDPAAASTGPGAETQAAPETASSGNDSNVDDASATLPAGGDEVGTSATAADETDVAEADRPEVVTEPLPPAEETFTITTRPEGARVNVNGEPVPGVTPLSITVPVDSSHRLGISLDGYEDAGLEIPAGTGDELSEADRTLFFPLTPDIPPGTLSIRSTYPVEVTVDGRSHRIDGEGALSLMPGDYEVQLRADDVFLRETRTIAIESDGTDILTLPPAVEVRIGAVPSYCRVRIDGIDIGYVPIPVLIVLGEHEFHFDWERLGEERTVTQRVGTDTESIFVSAREDRS